MSIKIEIDAERVLKAMLRAPDDFIRETRVEMKRQVTLIQHDARTHHDFNHRPLAKRRGYHSTGNLERSIQTEVSSSGFFGRVYLERGIAVYGPRIHRGWGTWRPDKFLTNAFERRAPYLQEAFNDAVNRGFQKAGL